MGELFDALSREDKNRIDFYITEFSGGRDAGNDAHAPLDYILKPWEEGKKDLYEMFGKNFILSKDYIYTESERTLANRLYDKTSWETFTNNLYHWINYNLMDITFFDNAFDNYPYHSIHFSVVNCVQNSLEGNVCFKYNEKKYTFPKGTKYIKFMGKIAELAGLDAEFEQFRIEHSMILNNAKQHGNLCLSIHPLDFMTMSDNASAWNSCMNWMDNGCYRMGSVEMMNSPTVVIAYLSASEDMEFGNYTWNNKKWRQLFVINEHVITAVKPYPYFDDNLTNTCLEWLNELAGKQYSEENFLFEAGENRYRNYYRLAPITNKMYNDFSSCEHLTKIKLPVPDKRESKVIRWSFNYSGKAECMWCGNTNFNDLVEDSLLCCRCDDSSDAYYCCNCGCRIYPDEDDYFVDENGDYYCIDCRDEYFTYDEFYDEYINSEAAVEVFLLKDRDNTERPWDQGCLSLWTHEDILYDNDGVFRNDEGDYCVFVDQASVRMLRQFFGAGHERNLNSLRKYVNKESYAGYDCFNIADLAGWYYNFRDNEDPSRRVPIVLDEEGE